MPPQNGFMKKRIRCSPERTTPSLLEKAILIVFELNWLHMNGGKNITHRAHTVNINIFSLLKNSKGNQPVQCLGAKEVRMVTLIREVNTHQGRNLKREVKILVT